VQTNNMLEVQVAILGKQFLLNQEQDCTPVNWSLPRTSLRRLIAEGGSHRTCVSAETGCGVSTLALSMMSMEHHRFTLLEEEVDGIREEADYSLAHGHLPEFDLLLIDGAHAFPYPMFDWFFRGRRLKEGGVLAVDDVWMPSVAMLASFLRDEEG